MYWEIETYKDGRWHYTYQARSKEEAKDLWDFTQRCGDTTRCREIRDLNSGSVWLA